MIPARNIEWTCCCGMHIRTATIMIGLWHLVNKPFFYPLCILDWVIDHCSILSNKSINFPWMVDILFFSLYFSLSHVHTIFPLQIVFECANTRHIGISGPESKQHRSIRKSIWWWIQPPKRNTTNSAKQSRITVSISWSVDALVILYYFIFIFMNIAKCSQSVQYSFKLYTYIQQKFE